MRNCWLSYYLTRDSPLQSERVLDKVFPWVWTYQIKFVLVVILFFAYVNGDSIWDSLGVIGWVDFPYASLKIHKDLMMPFQSQGCLKEMLISQMRNYCLLLPARVYFCRWKIFRDDAYLRYLSAKLVFYLGRSTTHIPLWPYQSHQYDFLHSLVRLSMQPHFCFL